MKNPIQNAVDQKFGVNGIKILKVLKQQVGSFGKKTLHTFFWVKVEVTTMGKTHTKTVQVEGEKVTHVFKRNLKF